MSSQYVALPLDQFNHLVDNRPEDLRDVGVGESDERSHNASRKIVFHAWKWNVELTVVELGLGVHRIEVALHVVLEMLVCDSPSPWVLVAERLKVVCSHMASDQILELEVEKHTAAESTKSRSGLPQAQRRDGSDLESKRNTFGISTSRGSFVGEGLRGQIN